MQTEPTLVILEQTTSLLGEQYRSFIEETANIETLELPKEAERRMKAASKKSSKAQPSPGIVQAATSSSSVPISSEGVSKKSSKAQAYPGFRIVQAATSSSSVPISSEGGIATGSKVTQKRRPPTVKENKTTRRAKKLNISTIKFHVLGHYPRVIRFFGPCDSFSSEWV
jgi:hypothetical protein